LLSLKRQIISACYKLAKISRWFNSLVCNFGNILQVDKKRKLKMKLFWFMLIAVLCAFVNVSCDEAADEVNLEALKKSDEVQVR